MAVTQLYNRTTNLNGLIEYVMNGDKTNEICIWCKLFT